MRLADLQDNFNKKFEHLVAVRPLNQWRHWLTQKLENSSTVVHELKDAIDHPRVHELLTHVEGLLNPYLSSLGIRASKVSSQSIELIIPSWWRTQSYDGAIDEGVQVSASQFAIHCLVRQSKLFQNIPSQTEAIELNPVQVAKGKLRARIEWTSLQQEAAWAELRNSSTCTVRYHVSFLSEDDLLTSEVFITRQFRLSEKFFQAGSP